MTTEELLELAAMVDHDQPDYTLLDEQIELLDNPEEALKNVLRAVHRDHL